MRGAAGTKIMTPFDYIVWLISLPAPIYIVARLAVRRELFRYFALAFYCLATTASNIGNFAVLKIYGIASAPYIYAYFYSESILAVLLFLVVLSMFRQLLEDMGATVYVRIAGILLLAGTAWVSFTVVQGHRDHMTGRFVVELGRDLNFVGVVLVYLLWTAIMKLRESRARMIQLALALGVYFSVYVLCYGLRQAHPEWAVLRMMPALVSTFLFYSWAYTFTKIPEEARLATARLAALATR
ncbi:MAG TPA: hypothetical protein VNF02_06790 [Candidatus Limnocylindrales bacterium]|nr:hypothetical protein [Candidatus Limnocylindrales bacterium]